MSAKQATNDKLQSSLAAYLMFGGVVDNQIKKGLLLSAPVHFLKEAQLSPSDRAMRLVSSNLANFHATVQKLLICKSCPNRWYEVGGLVGGNVS